MCLLCSTINTYRWTGGTMYTHIPIWVGVCKGLENVRLSRHSNIRLCSVFIMLCHKVVHRSSFIIIYKMKGMII